jgi:hypothetical protein
MTLPDERLRALKNTQRFLLDLLDRKKTPRVPKSVRKQAYWCLRHYPADYILDTLPELAPKDWGKTK